MNTAALVAKAKEKHPEAFCPAHRCLWRTGGGYCPRHKQAVSEVIHIDGDPRNNDISNLKIKTRKACDGHSAHSRAVARLSRARRKKCL